MKPVMIRFGAVILPLAAVAYVAQSLAAGPARFSGMCDASAVAALNDEYFVVADDEDTNLRVYSRLRPGRAAYLVNVASFLGLPRRSAEVDLEGAARIGERLYWISSHGRNAEGEEQLSRQRLFATTGSVSNGVVDLRPVGRPFSGLLASLVADRRLARFRLAEAAGRAPKDPAALNIEGLGSTPEGHLLIGFRNPIPEGRALIVPLLNPSAVVDGSASPDLGDPVLIDLRGLGIRSLEWRGGEYWIVAGSHDGEARSRMFRWNGRSDSAPRPVMIPALADLNPEAITFFNDAEGSVLWVVSDDGNVKVNGVDCKRLKDSRLKQFRAVAIPLPTQLAEAEQP